MNNLFNRTLILEKYLEPKICKDAREFKVGKYYKVFNDSPKDGTYLIVLKFKNIDFERIEGGYIENMNEKGDIFKYENCNVPYVFNREYKSASAEEKVWLDRCIAANKMLEP